MPPLLLALSANSPFWRADQTGLLSTRTPIFRAFPRVGIPPRYDDYEDWTKRIRFMVESKVIADYTVFREQVAQLSNNRLVVQMQVRW